MDARRRLKLVLWVVLGNSMTLIATPRGAPRRLFDSAYLQEKALPRSYDLSPDGTKFVMIEEFEEPAQSERFRMIDNFFEMLRDLAPARR